MEKVLNLTFASSLDSMCELNSSFDTGKLKIAYTGVNRNRSCIEKPVFESAIPSLHGVPLVCNYNVHTDTIGGHDMGVVANEDGELRLINLTEPVGYVPESAECWFENVTEEDGSVREYLCTDVLLWKRQAAYKHIKENGITAHSMEIAVKAGELKDGIYNISDFEFQALCLLGEDVEPCFESSALETYSAQNFSAEIAEMMKEAKKVFSTIGTTNVVDNIHPQKISEEGGEIVLEGQKDFAVNETEEQEAEVIAAEDPIVPEDPSPEVFTNTEEAELEVFENDENNELESQPEENFELNSNIVDNLYDAVSVEQITNRWGETMIRYSYVDYDADQNLVYVFDRKDWNLYGFNYSFNNDEPVVDFDSKRRMKWAIVEFNGAEQPSVLLPIFSEFEKKIDESKEFEQKFNEAEKTIESMNAELNELREFKAQTEKANMDHQRSELFAMFEDLNGIEAFEALKENSDLSIEDLEEKCFAIRGRNASQAKFSFETKSTKIKVDQSESKDAPYGGVVEKYLGSVD